MPNFVVIGSGIAGLNFALQASNLGKVLIITKKKAVDASTNFAQGGIAGVMSTLDSFDKHIEDTLIAGNQHNDKKAVEFMVRKAPEAIRNLIECGVKFANSDGEILLTREGGHSERRIAFVGDYTGKEIEEALIKNVKKNKNIKILEHAFAVDILTDETNKEAKGVRIIKDKKILDIYGNYVILATGGFGQVYEHTTNPAISTGDGLAMGERIGTQFEDLEFVQFHPTAFKHKNKAKFLISEAVRGEGAYLRNKNGQRFMQNIHPLSELAPRDIVARGIFEESKTGEIYLDISHKDPSEIEIRFPQIYQNLKKYGYNLTKDLIPITPAAHYACGGIKVNLKGETNIKNLYAFGEVACTGVHGANRLASNSLLEALVFSSEIIRNLPKNEKTNDEIQKIIDPKIKYYNLSKIQEKTLNKIKKSIKKLMWQNVGIVRRENELKEALTGLQKLKNEFQKTFNNKVNEKIIEIQNLLTVGNLITEAALKRKKSLGGHFLSVIPAKAGIQ